MVCSCASTQGLRGLSAGDHYLNLGSSFSAGSGTGPLKQGAVPRCYQTNTNHAALLARKYEFLFDEQGCAGATSEHILNAWDELPPQIDALRSDTKLVTITIGGNDLNFVGNLYADSCGEKTSYTINGLTISCAPRKLVQEEDYVRLEKNYHEILKHIQSEAPQARIVIVQYLMLLSDQRCPAIPLSDVELSESQLVGSRLRALLERVAAKNDVEVLAVDKISTDHTPCDEEPWAVGFLKEEDNANGWPWHPNTRGMEVIAEQLEKLLAR